MNIAESLVRSAERWPHVRAVVCPAGRDAAGRVTYSQWTFAQLHRESDRLAAGLRRMGVTPGMRMVLMVRPSLEFVALTFALFKAGAVVVLIDPGMGRASLLGCLDEVDPHGFVAVPFVQSVRMITRRYPRAKLNVTVGRRWIWGGSTYSELLRSGSAHESREFSPAATKLTDPAAILFTSGSTGPPKGVVYEHGMFAAQVEALRDYFQIQPGEIDLPGFPLFGLFNAAMGVTTVIPDMDPSRPAQVDPRKIVEAIRNQGVAQTFGSPAIWDRVGRYCEQHSISLPSLKRVMSAGAPVPEDVLRRMQNVLVAPSGGSHGVRPKMHTPYGATEALPVCAITAREVLERTAIQTRQGAGTCVGRPFPGIGVKIVEMTDGPIASLQAVRELHTGQIGEIIVRGKVVTREYFHQPEATALAKIPDRDGFWHRMGDVGYIGADRCLWFCGRKSHVVETESGRLFTDCVEPIFNTHPQVYRTALVGLGERPRQTPVIVVELEREAFPRNPTTTDMLEIEDQLRKIGQVYSHTQRIERFVFHPSLPVDTRHNVKINREALAEWAARL